MRAFLATLLGLLLLTGCSRQVESPRGRLLTQAQADALEAKILLTELRAGRITNAVELLEQKLDSSIIVMGGLLPRASASERSTALGTLESLEAYRATHPRNHEAILPDSEPFAPETEKIKQEASRILREVK